MSELGSFVDFCDIVLFIVNELIKPPQVLSTWGNASLLSDGHRNEKIWKQGHAVKEDHL